jgi:hypothetical protein
MIRVGQHEREVPVWLWAAVPFAFVALAIQESTRWGIIGTEPDVYYLHIVTRCAVASVAGFLLMDLMRRARTPWYGLPFLLMASFAASMLAISWLNGAMRELMAIVVGAAITAAAGRGGTGAAGLLLMGIMIGVPLLAGALLTLMFTLASRYLACLPLWSRDARRDLWANLGAMMLWLVVAFGGYIAIRSSFRLAWGFSSTPVPPWLPVVAAVLAAVLATSAHLALAERARRNELNERHGLRVSLLAAICLAAYFYNPSLFGFTAYRFMQDQIRPALRAIHVLPTPVLSIASYVVDVPYHDNRTKLGKAMPDGKPSYAYAPLPSEYGLTSDKLRPTVFVYRRDITLQETSNVWIDQRKALEEKQAKEPGQDAVIRAPGPRGQLGMRSDQYPDVDFMLGDLDASVSSDVAEQALRRFIREHLRRVSG